MSDEKHRPLLCRIGLHPYSHAAGFENATNAHVECSCCGKRKIVYSRRGWAPIDRQWLATGIKSSPPLPPSKPRDASTSTRPRLGQ